jgi:hypothetical protein
MKIKTFITLTIIFLFLSFSCKETPPEPGNGGGRDGGMLTVEDVGVTDAVLRLRVPGGFKSRSITLKRDTTTILSRQIASLDLTIVDEKLLPKCSYRYTLTVENFLNSRDRSYADITTMDTTSHNFTWQIFKFGFGISSTLRDVVIINDTCIIAVGEIYDFDSTGQSEMYNLVKWNGKKWILQKLEALKPSGTHQLLKPYSIIGFSPQDVWLAAGDVHHYNGSTVDSSYWITYGWGNPNPIFLIYYQYITKLWGTSSNNLYGCGTLGGFAHFDGNRWQKLDTPPMISSDGVVLDFQDIWGAKNPRTGDLEIMAVASNTSSSAYGMIFKISGTEVTKFNRPYKDFDPISGVWFMPGQMYYVVGTRIFKNRYPLDRNSQWRADVGSYQADYYKTAVRGNGLNDIVVACQDGDLLHFNGVNWVNFKKTVQLDVGHFRHMVAMKGNMIVAVGDNYGYAVVAIGRR